VFYTGGNVEPLSPAEVDLSCLQGASLLLVDGFQMEAQIPAAEEARRQGIRVLLDAGTISEGMGELVALSDVLIASERYASEVAPRGEIEDSLIELSRMGPRIVVVTLGKEGSIGLEGDKLVHQPPLQVAAKDTTGAGDVYFGGYAYGLLQGWPLERCMQIASAAAGLSCRELGARAALPDLEEVEAVSWQEMRT
jgi:ribokinase